MVALLAAEKCGEELDGVAMVAVVVAVVLLDDMAVSEGAGRGALLLASSSG
jgi:hypothetical protein